ncbi:MAG TPA: hypothetical protein VFV94_09390 [Polyangiaceae bacterium]|nr:hypothetical protein [Polyangiaceae bacterium]
MLHRQLTSLSLGFIFMGALAAAPAVAGPPPGVFRPTLELGAAETTASGVKVGADGAEWALPGGARIVADADAELRVIAKPQQLNLGAKRRVPTYTVALQSGRVRAIVPDGATSAVIVAAPRKAAVLVPKGEAGVFAGDNVAVASARGETLVGIGGKAFRALPAGSVEVIGGGRHTLLDAPRDLAGPSVLFANGAPVELGSMPLTPVDGASAYRVELRDRKTARLVARTVIKEPRVPAGLARLAPGAYSLRVTSLDDAGFESTLPLERPLNVVHLGLPAGSFIDAAGVVHFAPGSRLGLERTDGVEMRVGHTGDFAAAPPSLELLRAEPRLLGFRAGSGPATELWLVPRVQRATIEFGSRAPHWPGEPLAINVKIEDSTPDPAGAVEVKPVVSVGIEPVAVEFKRDGAWLRGTLSPRDGAGPWVVRVEVRAHDGRELGRDFVEVAVAER